MELFYSSDIDGTLINLDSEESGHCVKVLRHRAGDEVNIIDGQGNLYRCTLLQADPRAAVAQVLEKTAGFGSHPYRLTMAVCPTKNTDRFEWFAEKATEVGLDAIIPVIGDHSERKVFKTERVRRLVLSAAKQSQKALLPAVEEPVSVADFIRSAPAEALRLICYCDSTLPREKRVGIVQALRSSSSSEICILIGPEGDFSEAELELAFSLGWLPVHLGDSRLRTETAALTAVTAVYLEKAV